MEKLIVTIVLVISSLSFAQEKRKLSPEQQTELQVKKMTLDLDLDARQLNTVVEKYENPFSLERSAPTLPPDEIKI